MRDTVVPLETPPLITLLNISPNFKSGSKLS